MSYDYVRKTAARALYIGFAMLALASWLDLWAGGQAADIPSTLVPLLLPRKWWRWMWR